jgi:alkyl sulfatase BDS1-like metallo-beta-lactamase superfamily hydrolase
MMTPMRGPLIGAWSASEPATLTAADGRVLWDVDKYAFLDGDCPDTANPSLWRQGALTARQGLYQVTEGVYQVRGMDLSNMSLIEGDTGVIVVDPLVSAETAAAAMELYFQHRGTRPVTGMIYTHPHFDHFGGVLGVISESADVPIIAPEHFMEHAVSENVYAGTAMIRRGMYFGGAVLDRGPQGRIGMGLGIETSPGSVGLLPPTLDITKTGQEEVIDGVRLRFQMTPGTEAPAEMNFLVVDRRALCMAENATHTLHNLLTLRGAQVRDARIWSRYLDEAVQLFAEDTDVAFASHHWPTWGKDNVVTFLATQRDLYAYLHDQTLRLMNSGYTGIEIAEMIQMPPSLQAAWNTHGYYGSVSHNVKAIYQRYMGWFDGNPAHLWQHPPQEQARRYVDTIGGLGKTLQAARGYADGGDLRFAAEPASHAVFTHPDDQGARQLLAEVLTKLGYGTENGIWRNFYLTSAYELQNGVPHTAIALAASLASALSMTQIFDSIAIRIDGPRAWDHEFAIHWVFTDLGRTYRTQLSNGALTHHANPTGAADLTLTLTRRQLLLMLAGQGTDGVKQEGDTTLLPQLMSLLDEGNPDFAIVTP